MAFKLPGSGEPTVDVQASLHVFVVLKLVSSGYFCAVRQRHNSEDDFCLQHKGNGLENDFCPTRQGCGALKKYGCTTRRRGAENDSCGARHRVLRIMFAVQNKDGGPENDIYAIRQGMERFKKIVSVLQEPGEGS